MCKIVGRSGIRATVSSSIHDTPKVTFYSRRYQQSFDILSFDKVQIVESQEVGVTDAATGRVEGERSVISGGLYTGSLGEKTGREIDES